MKKYTFILAILVSLTLAQAQSFVISTNIQRVVSPLTLTGEQFDYIIKLLNDYANVHSSEVISSTNLNKVIVQKYVDYVQVYKTNMVDKVSEIIDVPAEYGETYSTNVVELPTDPVTYDSQIVTNSVLIAPAVSHVETNKVPEISSEFQNRITFKITPILD